jgi:ketosteroid isomerase-like protein
VDPYRDQLKQLRNSFNRRDSDGFAAMWDANCEWHPFLTARVEGDLGYHGHNGIRAWFEDTDEMFSEVQVALDQFREVRGRLLVLGR